MPLTFGVEDSATNGFRILYRAADGEVPVLDGGVYRVAVEAQLEKSALSQLQPGQLSTSLSRALFSLMIDQTLQFENKADVGRSIVFTGRDGLRADHRDSWVRRPQRAAK